MNSSCVSFPDKTTKFRVGVTSFIIQALCLVLVPQYVFLSQDRKLFAPQMVTVLRGLSEKPQAPKGLNAIVLFKVTVETIVCSPPRVFWRSIERACRPADRQKLDTHIWRAALPPLAEKKKKNSCCDFFKGLSVNKTTAWDLLRRW